MAIGVLVSLGLAKVTAIVTLATIAKQKRNCKTRKKEQKGSFSDNKKQK
ncbi:MAG: hypothetical protein ACYSRR_04170 [Planctomycetota bacterium]|jgi:hypothetical protein